MKFKPLELTDVKISIRIEPEDLAVEDSFQFQEDIDYVHKQINSGNEWAWCTVWVVAKWEGHQGEDNLGGCSYQSEEDFRKCDYFADMQQRALDELNEFLEGEFQSLIKRAV